MAGRGAEVGDQGLAGGAGVGFPGGADVVADGFFGDAELPGDQGVGEALEQELFDFVALGGGAVGGVALVGEFAVVV